MEGHMWASVPATDNDRYHQLYNYDDICEKPGSG